MKLRADLDLCQGHGVCAEEAPEVFAVDPRGRRYYPCVRILQERPPEELRSRVERAVRLCPTRALSIEEDSGGAPADER